MADPPRQEKAVKDHRNAPAITDLAAEAERGRSARTPFLALAGVWVVVAAVVTVVLVLALTLYFVYR